MKALAILPALALAACTAGAPTPTPSPTPVPTPVPTPTVIVKTVEVPGPTVTIPIPTVCFEAVRGLMDVVDAENGMLDAYIHSKKPSAAQEGAFLALDPDGIYADVNACLAKE